MPVTQARLPGFQSAKSARWYQALIGPIQVTGSASGFDFWWDYESSKTVSSTFVPASSRLRSSG